MEVFSKFDILIEVSYAAVTLDGSILATGSCDTTVMVWEVFRVKAPDKRVRNMPTEMPRKDYVISETPFHILCGHDDIITCLYVSVELNIVLSGSKDGTCVFHTLREGRYLRSLRHPAGVALSKLVASRHGRIVLYADDDLSLHLYSINGKHIATSESNGRLNCVELSSCGEFLVCAGDQGQIVVRSMNSLETVRRYNGVGKSITSLAVTPEECFLAGTKDGSLLVYSIENPQLRKTSLPRNLKSKDGVRRFERQLEQKEHIRKFMCTLLQVDESWALSSSSSIQNKKNITVAVFDLEKHGVIPRED
ncbi:unnamed protein product [Ilex paraguariensis]|uniref:Neurobeachin beta-propeller domain-containing protein n=1 Tax=Ilex paraguariensis TaxID=185542 RepID=A0ABC8UZQ2_9AQUA